MLNRISEIGIHISIQNLLREERVNDISRYDVAPSTYRVSKNMFIKRRLWEKSDQKSTKSGPTLIPIYNF